MRSAFLTLRISSLAEEFTLRGAQAFDHQQERPFGNRCMGKELPSVSPASAAQLLTSMHTVVKAVNCFRELTPEPYRLQTTGETMGLRLPSQNA